MKPATPIIIAESDFLTGTLLAAALESSGHRALVTRDGDHLFELIAAHAPQLLVLSMNLARPGGVQMLRKLRQQDVPLRILATTRAGQTNLRATAKTLGVTAFLELPFSPDDLHRQIVQLLSLPR